MYAFFSSTSSAVSLRTCPISWQWDWPHPLVLGRYHCKHNSLPLPSPVCLHHSGRWQHTNDSFKTQKLFWCHRISQQFFSFLFLGFFPSLFWEAGSKWYTGQLGYWENTQHPIHYAWQVSFMLWDTSAISDLSAAPPVVPLLPVYHAGCQGCPISLSFDMGWEWQAGERGRPQPSAERQAGGWGSEYSCWKLSGSCQVIPEMKIFHHGLSPWLETFPNPPRAFPEALNRSHCS